MNFLIINGPNMNLLGKREPSIYGPTSYASLCAMIEDYAKAHQSTARCFQSNHEGAIIDELHAAEGVYDAIIINPGAYTHYSYAILDAIRGISVPVYEVHISQIDKREPFRAISVTAPACVGQICGIGTAGYLRAMDHFLQPPPRLCVIGDPVDHSLSPSIHKAMLSALKMPGDYTIQQVKLSELPQFLDRVRSGEFTGFNATMPHKRNLVELVDELDYTARLTQSVNTVCLENGKLKGYSTDGAGLVKALQQNGFQPEGAKVALLGTGGAARSVAASLAQAGAKCVAVCGRSKLQVDTICETVYEAAHGATETEPYRFDQASLTNACFSAQVLINCTCLGMEGKEQFEDFEFLDLLPRSAPVCDVVYHPLETELLRHAKHKGHLVINGLCMLICQGVLALEKFLGGIPLNYDLISSAARDALKGEREW